MKIKQLFFDEQIGIMAVGEDGKTYDWKKEYKKVGEKTMGRMNWVEALNPGKWEEVKDEVPF